MKSSIELLNDWVNTHDCGVHPTGIILDGAVVVRVATSGPDGSKGVEEITVKNIVEARRALGY